MNYRIDPKLSRRFRRLASQLVQTYKSQEMTGSLIFEAQNCNCTGRPVMLEMSLFNIDQEPRSQFIIHT